MAVGHGLGDARDLAPMASAAGHGPVVLVILDGWGIAPPGPGNAVALAATPVMDRLLASYPTATLRPSGEDVGLPAGQMGNSEVGHLNLGAGFVVYQWLTRLDKAITDGDFFTNAAFHQAVERVRATGGTLHLMGLVSDGGVHSHLAHLKALLRLAKEAGLTWVAVHAFTDGRDTAPTGGLNYVADIEHTMDLLGIGRIATVSGRYYAMDRDHRWDRVRRAYNALVYGIGPRATDAATAIEASYAAGITDEFILPTVIASDDDAVCRIQPGDAAIFFNFRADRARQLTEALTRPDFTGFARGIPLPALTVVTMARYEVGLPVTVAFTPHDVEYPLARVISEAGRRQFHTAETEKYAHVTFFLNGGREAPFPGEDRALVPSPKVATYDLQPEMSAAGVAAGVLGAVASRAYDFIIVNFANADMVGHTGSVPAATLAVETVDRCLGEIVTATLALGGRLLVTADHGNAEVMVEPATGGPMTAHTTNLVPIVLVTPDADSLRHAALRPDGRLSAVAPTVLVLLGVPIPLTMTEPPLLPA